MDGSPQSGNLSVSGSTEITRTVPAVIVYDELSISFDNPATDSMGYDHVSGKLYCGRDQLELQFKVKDRAFRKNEIRTVIFEYSEVESIEVLSRWFRPKRLIFQTPKAERLEDFPGAQVGRIELQVLRASSESAEKISALIQYKQSEAFLAESETRLNQLRENS